MTLIERGPFASIPKRDKEIKRAEGVCQKNCKRKLCGAIVGFSPTNPNMVHVSGELASTTGCLLFDEGTYLIPVDRSDSYAFAQIQGILPKNLT